MDDEINSLEMHNVWEPIDRPKKKKVIAVGCGWKQGTDFEESFNQVKK